MFPPLLAVTAGLSVVTALTSWTVLLSQVRIITLKIFHQNWIENISVVVIEIETGLTSLSVRPGKFPGLIK